MIIGFANFKGGVGKTVLSLNIATELDRLGYRVGLIDAEEGGPATFALEKVAPHIPRENTTTLETIDDAVARLKTTCDIVIFDTPGKTGDEFLSLCLLADFIIVPIGPSKKDLRRTKPLLTLLRAFQLKANGKPKSSIVLNFTRIVDIAARKLREQLEPIGIPLAKTQIRRLDDYRDNESVMIDPILNARGAATDVRRLIKELFLDELPEPRKMANE